MIARTQATMVRMPAIVPAPLLKSWTLVQFTWARRAGAAKCWLAAKAVLRFKKGMQ
jgi:hypothetical protein